MAHLSGYSGSITFPTGDPGWGGSIQSWRVINSIVINDVTVMGAVSRSRITGLSKWRAIVDFLPQDNLGGDTFQVGKVVAVRFIFKGTPFVPTGYLHGNGLVESYDALNPLDGPFRATCVIVSNGNLFLTMA